MATNELIQRIRRKDWNVMEPPNRIPPNAGPAIVPLLTDKDQGVRELAVAALDRTSGPETKQGLFEALGDRDEVVRGAAARNLHHHCGAGDVVALIAQVHTHKDEYVREELALLLGKLGQKSATKPLQERFAAEQWPHTQRAISLALVRLGDPSHRQAYIARLGQPDPKERVAALDDLLYLEDKTLLKDVKPLLDDGRDGKNVGPSHGAYWIRVCDVAVNVVDALLGHPFKFQVRGNKRYSTQEIDDAKRVIQ
jgi:HEAT repeat protein